MVAAHPTMRRISNTLQARRAHQIPWAAPAQAALTIYMVMMRLAQQTVVLAIASDQAVLTTNTVMIPLALRIVHIVRVPDVPGDFVIHPRLIAVRTVIWIAAEATVTIPRLAAMPAVVAAVGASAMPPRLAAMSNAPTQSTTTTAGVILW